jgi:hypothetical protein
MIKRVAVFSGNHLPFVPVKVTGKDAGGRRIVEGVRPYTNEHADIPYGREVGYKWKAYSLSERQALIAEKMAKIERAEKKAAKILAASLPKVPKVRLLREGETTFVGVSEENVPAKLKEAEDKFRAKFREKQAKKAEKVRSFKSDTPLDRNPDILPADRAAFKPMSDEEKQAWSEKCGGRKVLTAPAYKNRAA